MSRSDLDCPLCGKTLAHRRWNGNIRFQSMVKPGDRPNSAVLVCSCGGRVEVEGVVLTLLSTNKGS